MGAELAVDFRKESYSDVVRDISVVVDTLGREKDGAQRMLEEAKGAAYVSLQPKVLKVRFNLIEGGNRNLKVLLPASDQRGECSVSPAFDYASS